MHALPNLSTFIPCCLIRSTISTPNPHLRKPLELSMKTHNNPDPFGGRARLTKALRSRFNNLVQGTNFAVGGKAIMQDPDLDIHGFGKFEIKNRKSEFASQVEALSTIALQAGYGFGSETIVDLDVRNTLQIDATKISITNQDWTRALHDLIADIGKEMNFEVENVEPKLYKLLIYGPGGHFKPHVDNEKHDGMFGTLMIELPSIYEGGELVVYHCDNARTFDDGAFKNSPVYGAFQVPIGSYFAPFEMKFLAHYADCKHEVKEVSSGYRLALIYSLCWKGKGEKAPTPKTPEQVSDDILHHQISFDGCLGYVLEHHYSIASLARYGAKALKGSDRTVYSFLTNASSILESQASTSSDRLIMYIVKASRQDLDRREGPNMGKPKIESYEDDIFGMDGSEPAEQDVKILKTFRTAEYEDIINNRDPVWINSGDSDDEELDFENKRVNDPLWRDALGKGPTYIGNEGGEPETFYTTFILTFLRENWSKTQSAVDHE